MTLDKAIIEVTKVYKSLIGVAESTILTQAIALVQADASTKLANKSARNLEGAIPSYRDYM